MDSASAWVSVLIVLADTLAQHAGWRYP